MNLSFSAIPGEPLIPYIRDREQKTFAIPVLRSYWATTTGLMVQDEEAFLWDSV
jgi:hypothetical protein